MDLFPAVAEQIFDLAAVLRVIEDIAHCGWPPLAASSCRRAVAIKGVGNALEGGAVLP